MVKIKGAVKIDEVTNRFQKIASAGANLKAPLTSIGEIVCSSVEKNFTEGGRFQSASEWRGGGNRWQDLAESTKAARAKKGKWPGRILDMSQGGLAASVSKKVTGNSVAVGSNKVYAAIHQYGGKAGRGGKVTIPARPFLVIQDEDVEDMMDVLDNHLKNCR